MSIPPLVCSTPPPPDQCEDDKDPEDFELSYSLSQDEDEDDGYNYGNFSSFNYQSTTDTKPLDITQQEITKAMDSEVNNKMFLKFDIANDSKLISHNVFGANDINENKVKSDEDLSIEDLNLKVGDEIDSISESNTEKMDLNEPNISNVKESDIPSNSSSDSPDSDKSSNLMSDENVNSTDELQENNTQCLNVNQNLEAKSDEEITQAETYVDDIEINILDTIAASSAVELDKSIKVESSSKEVEIEEKSEDYEEPLELSVTHLESPEVNVDDDDDFGDFDDFQSVNTNLKNVVEISNNPWENVEANESQFGNFTANFDDNTQESDLNMDHTEVIADNLSQLKINSKESDDNLDDDDFGDFDDFKSSSVKTEPIDENVSSCQDMPVLNLQSTENEQQIMENITKVLSSVFLEEISEPESGFEGKLESLLSETWGHLMQTDERQPYIVNWNNSLGQKTLLKALCIDSRNILFGPKWSSNMPKYAANLSNAPLQPQKQASVPSSLVTQNEVIAEKPASKPATTTWSDPFTSEGQESCNTENESSPVVPAPLDLDAFEAAMSAKSEKKYSNTMGIQPIRQISLPDTHIFTPTDSEIPRSKTIHYDRNPQVLLPQSGLTDKNQTDIVTSPSGNIEDNSGDDSEYWEFQNFKSSKETSSLPSNNSQQISPQEDNSASAVNALPKQNIPFKADMLQPIKVEPLMPTLNWPDPGEIKGGFDDFSDFVTISPQSSEKPQSSLPLQVDLKTEIGKMNNELQSDSIESTSEISRSQNVGNDDDFDNFQSAPTFKSASDVAKTNYLENSFSHISQSAEVEKGSPKFTSIKSDTILFASVLKPIEALTSSISYSSNSTDFTNISSSMSTETQLQTNMLQPIPASFTTVNSQPQHKSGQILQPLSLESYSQINWPSPGIDLQDLSRFNPVETLHSLKSDLSVSGASKGASPVHTKNSVVNKVPDDDWGEFVSSKPKQQQSLPKKPLSFVDDDEWTDFISSPTVKPQNGLNTISFNVHTNSGIQKSTQNKSGKKSNQPPLDIPSLNYITPKTNPHKSYNDKHFQNL